MTYAALLTQGKSVLKSAGIADFEVDAWLILSHVTHFDRADFYMYAQDNVPSAIIDEFNNLIDIRTTRKPLQYMLGTTSFMGYDFYVKEGVLIPRPDTEVLCEQALKVIKDNDRVLDMCTGSGCIIISVTKKAMENGVDGLVAIGADVSDEAIELSTRNAAYNETTVEIIKSDLFENISGKFNVILSNPPYIVSDEIDGLMPEVRDYEPHLALDGGDDGLDYYRRLSTDAKDYLIDGGHILFEIGFEQGAAVKDIMISNGYKEVEVIKDYAGNDRVVKATK